MRVNKHLILTTISCIGVVGVAVASVCDTVRATKKKANPEKPVDYVKTYWKDYIPTALAVSATAGTIIANHKITSDELKAIGTCAAGSMILAQEYKRKIREHYGKDELNNIVKEIAKDKEIDAQQAQDVYIYSSGAFSSPEDPSVNASTLFYDEFTDTWFRSSLYSVKNAHYHFNRNFSMRGDAAIQELYEFYGITPKWTIDPLKYGYNIDMMYSNEMYWIDFELVESETDGGEKYYIIYPVLEPLPYDEEEGTFMDPDLKSA